MDGILGFLDEGEKTEREINALIAFRDDKTQEIEQMQKQIIKLESDRRLMEAGTNNSQEAVEKMENEKRSLVMLSAGILLFVIFGLLAKKSKIIIDEQERSIFFTKLMEEWRNSSWDDDKNQWQNLEGFQETLLLKRNAFRELKDNLIRLDGDLNTEFEEEVDGFHIDIVRGSLLIEIQTANFSSIKTKLNKLTEKHPVRLVFPIAQEKWIVRLASDGMTRLGRRKSPKKGNLYHLFAELVSIPDLIKVKNFSLEVVLIQEEEVRCDDSRGSWRRKGLSIMDHCLIEVLSHHTFKKPSDFAALIPSDLPEPYSTKELAESIAQPRWLAQKMAYCLRSMGVLDIVGKNGNSLLYSASNTKKA